MNGPGTSTEWAIEGRRLVSLMPRLVPQTVFTAKASAAANLAVEKNKQLPIKTGKIFKNVIGIARLTTNSLVMQNFVRSIFFPAEMINWKTQLSLQIGKRHNEKPIKMQKKRQISVLIL